MSERPNVSILGVGNLGRALATGWVRAQLFTAAEITLTRRDSAKLEDLAQSGHPVGSDNTTAVSASDVLVLAVQPQQLQALLEEIRPVLDGGRHRVISVVSGVSIRQIRDALGANVPVVRAMPNTAVSIGESMTCLCSDGAALAEATELFRSRRPNARDRRADDGASHRTVRLRCGVFPPVRACSLTGGASRLAFTRRRRCYSRPRPPKAPPRSPSGRIHTPRAKSTGLRRRGAAPSQA